MILIKGGNVHLPTGESQSCDVLIDGKKIAGVGEGLSAGPDCETISAVGKEVFAGFISPITSVGCMDMTSIRQPDSMDTSNPVTAQLDVKDSMDHREVLLQQYYFTGITAFGLSPGTKNLVSGIMGVYNTDGKNNAQMTVRNGVALKGNFISDVKGAYGKRGVAPMTKMGCASLLRTALVEARDYSEKKADADGDKSKLPPFDQGKETLGRLLARELTFFVHAKTQAEILTVIEIAKEFSLKLVLTNACQADKCAEEIKKAGIPVVLPMFYTMGYEAEYDIDFKKLIKMADEGVQFSVSSSGDSGFAGRETLLWCAIKLYNEGFDAESVIKMLTINPASMLGVDDVIGSIETGKQADIAIYNAHPVKTYAADVDTCIVAGKVTYRKGECANA